VRQREIAEKRAGRVQFERKRREGSSVHGKSVKTPEGRISLVLVSLLRKFSQDEGTPARECAERSEK